MSTQEPKPRLAYTVLAKIVFANAPSLQTTVTLPYLSILKHDNEVPEPFDLDVRQPLPRKRYTPSARKQHARPGPNHARKYG